MGTGDFCTKSDVVNVDDPARGDDGWGRVGGGERRIGERGRRAGGRGVRGRGEGRVRWG